MTDAQVLQAYAARAAEYTSVLGAIEDMHELDRCRVQQWAEQISGPVIDAGCGPGHWTDFLHRRGVDVSGVDLVPEFIESARVRFPEVSFQVSSIRALDLADGSMGGVLAWYSLIHLDPTELPHALSELRRVLRPEGHLLVGFFMGASAEPLDHAVTRAYYWSVDQMSRLLEEAGFEVLDVEKRRDHGSRPHAAIAAVGRASLSFTAAG
ncbi:UNVERIFIED_ORG: SAM-dependent methyltransferase [Arthrobacter sp. UYEF10]